jgi:hypothetical protein
MTATAKVVQLTTTRLHDLGRKALNLLKKLEPIQSDLEAIKTQLRDAAQGETQTFEVPGLGKVTISKPGEAASWREWEAQQEVIDNLPKAERQRLLKLGVIKQVTKERKEKAASITLKLNA